MSLFDISELETVPVQREAILSALKEYLDTEAGAVLCDWTPDEFIAHYQTGIRPTLYLKAEAEHRHYQASEAIAGLISPQCRELDLVLFVEASALLAAHDVLRPFGELIKPELSKYAGKIIGTTMDWDDYDERPFCIDVPADRSRIALDGAFRVALTVPDLYFVLPEMTQDGAWKNPHLRAKTDAHDGWLRFWRRHLRRPPFMQIGGWGDFVQQESDDEYVAQLNADIGNSGSLYLLVHPDKLSGTVQMC